MFFGLPLRVASTTTEFVTKPSYSSLFQSFATFFASTSLSTSGASDSATTSAQARLDGARLVAGGAVGLLEADALAVVGLLEGRDDLLVGLLRRRVGDQAEAACRCPAESLLPPQAATPSTTRMHQRHGRDRDSLSDAHVRVSPFVY